MSTKNTVVRWICGSLSQAWMPGAAWHAARPAHAGSDGDGGDFVESFLENDGRSLKVNLSEVSSRRAGVDYGCGGAWRGGAALRVRTVAVAVAAGAGTGAWRRCAVNGRDGKEGRDGGDGAAAPRWTAWDGEGCGGRSLRGGGLRGDGLRGDCPHGACAQAGWSWCWAGSGRAERARATAWRRRGGPACGRQRRGRAGGVLKAGAGGAQVAFRRTNGAGGCLARAWMRVLALPLPPMEGLLQRRARREPGGRMKRQVLRLAGARPACGWTRARARCLAQGEGPWRRRRQAGLAGRGVIWAGPWASPLPRASLTWGVGRPGSCAGPRA